MLTYLFINILPDTWKPSTYFYMFGLELPLDLTFFMFVLYLVF